MTTNIIIALDGLSKSEILNVVSNLKDLPFAYKIGDAIIHHGIGLVSDMKFWGASRVMVDLKLYDIPSTITRHIDALDSVDVDIITVHMSADYSPNMDIVSKIAGVTVLTSFNNDSCEHIYGDNVKTVIVKFTSLACMRGYGYLVCSPKDLKHVYTVKNNLTCDNIKIICPGIRMDDDINDHGRPATPKFAGLHGADYLVVGRPILQYKDDVTLMKKMMYEIYNDYKSGIEEN